MSNLQVEYRTLSELKPNLKNPRLHPDKQVHQLAASIREFGFNSPLIIDPNGIILAGHGRFQAAQLLGLDKVPTIPISHLNEARKLGFALADNKIALNSNWDPEILKLDILEIQLLDDPSFEIALSGFDTAEIDLIVDGSAAPQNPCVGSGTTIIAAEKCGRRARALEIDPLYVDVAIRHWQEFTGRNAELDVFGDTFDETEQRRAAPRPFVKF